MSEPTPISDDAVRNWMEAYRQAWLARDPDQVVRLFTADALYQERRFKPGVTGTAGIRGYWQGIVHEQQRDVMFSYELLATRGPVALVAWRAQFTWLPINSIMELDAVSRIDFVPGPDLPLARVWEEWIDIREAK